MSQHEHTNKLKCNNSNNNYYYYFLKNYGSFSERKVNMMSMSSSHIL